MTQTFEVIGNPKIESEYCDEWETTMVIDLKRDDGETGDVWIVAGVPASDRGSSEASGSQSGYLDVWVLGDSVDCWCPASFMVADEDGGYSDLADAIVAACSKVAIATHRAAMQS